ncbi:MAG: hypothetical protein JWR50_982 [Mucilaginibacter sp.]|nr:hypothetical protein [Mucilaginibacter sp.]
MINEFPLNSNSRNKLIAEISEIIKKYYPIDVNNLDPTYAEYPGIVELMKIVEENMTHYKRLIKPWNDFLKKLRTGSTKKIHNSGFMHEIAFSGEMIIQQSNYKSLKHIKKIVFSVSLIAPMFSILGIDETLILDYHDELQHDVRYSAINVVTPSPYKEFETGFNYILKSIQEQFPNYKFVPFYVTQRFVKGLQTPNSYIGDCRVHNALFNRLFDYCPNNIFLRGDKSFGLEPSNIKVTLLPPPPLD